MITRNIESTLLSGLKNVPVIALLGPRQVGKTTLALKLADQLLNKEIKYLDLELDSDLNKLVEPESYLRQFENQLLIIDEVQIKPELFKVIRSLIDLRMRSHENAGKYLLICSASGNLLKPSSETLAGRIRYLEMYPFSALEIYNMDPLGFNVEKLWFRGGFPNSFLGINDTESWEWRIKYISTYVERDIPLMGPHIAPMRLKRFWTMLAHYHGQQVAYSELGKSLELSHTTIKSYLDILSDFYMVRQIQPWSGNSKKRLIKTPKIYLRDSGLLHCLLNISNFESLLGNPIIGASWEGFVIENIIMQLSSKWQYSYYKTASQTEVGLVLETPENKTWAIEVKKSLVPKVSKYFHTACEDIGANSKFVIYSGSERYPISSDTEAIGLIEFLKMLELENQLQHI